MCVNEHVITLYVYGTADEPFLILYATVLYSCYLFQKSSIKHILIL